AGVNRIVRRVGDPRRFAVQADNDGDQRGDDHGDGAERFALAGRRHPWLPRHRLRGGVGVCAGPWIGGDELDERRELRAAADVAQPQAAPARVSRMDVEGGEAEHALPSRLRTRDVADVVERELAITGDESEIRKEIAAAGPEPPLERVHDLEKLTFGTCVAAGGA